MKLAVVILNWNATEDTRRCIGAVKAWRSSADLPPPTIWVVDNGSTEPGLQPLRQDDLAVRFIASSVNRGFAGGNNLGIAAALADGSDAILLLNNDATLPGDGVTSMVTTLCSDPRIGVVGPTLWEGDRLLSAGGRDIARHVVTHIRTAALPKDPTDVDHVSGTAVLIHRRVFERVGLLDEDYFFGGEMADLCHRARELRIRSVIDPHARAQHDLQRSSTVRETLHLYYVLRNRFLYISKHHRRQRAWLYCVWCLRGAHTFVLAALRGRWRRARAVGLGLIDGLSGRFGGQNERVLG
jgi:GT2 family glycosyltransferase